MNWTLDRHTTQLTLERCFPMTNYYCSNKVDTMVHLESNNVPIYTTIYLLNSIFQFLFFLFLIWMVFIIMNLLVGLTVNRIEELMKTGEKIQASKRVEDIVGMAKLVFESQISKNLNFCIKREWMPWMQKGIVQSLGNSRKVFFWHIFTLNNFQ